MLLTVVSRLPTHQLQLPLLVIGMVYLPHGIMDHKALHILNRVLSMVRLKVHTAHTNNTKARHQ